MRADFQQYYSLNLSEMGSTYSVWHAAELVQHLPADSRTTRAINPEDEYTLVEHLLEQIEFWARSNYWAHTDDAKSGKNRPEPLFEQIAKEKNKPDVYSAPKSDVKRLLEQPRKEVR